MSRTRCLKSSSNRSPRIIGVIRLRLLPRTIHFRNGVNHDYADALSRLRNLQDDSIELLADEEQKVREMLQRVVRKCVDAQGVFQITANSATTVVSVSSEIKEQLRGDLPDDPTLDKIYPIRGNSRIPLCSLSLSAFSVDVLSLLKKNEQQALILLVVRPRENSHLYAISWGTTVLV